MIDDSADAADTPSAGPGPYPGAVSGVSYGNMSAGDAMIMSPTTTGPPVSLTAGQQGLMAAPQQQNYPSMTQLLDQDWDPFGLSASMQFPSQFSFDTSNMR